MDKLESALSSSTTERSQELLQLNLELKAAAESLRDLERQLTQACNDATREQARADGLSEQNQVIFVRAKSVCKDATEEQARAYLLIIRHDPSRMIRFHRA